MCSGAFRNLVISYLLFIPGKIQKLLLEVEQLFGEYSSEQLEERIMCSEQLRKLREFFETKDFADGLKKGYK